MWGAAALIGSDALQSIWLDRGLSYRPAIWSQTFSAFASCNPLIGCGIAAPLEVEYLPETVTDRAHSLYVAAIYHQGFLGAAVFFGAMAWLLYCARGRRRDWAIVLVYVLLASTTSGDHLLVRTTLFWCYFWLPVMVLAASTTALSERENSQATAA